ncbi:MAG: hypothetical protein RBS77_06585 [Candidatus Moranbacteria bacterium]|jgi:hypothetical protein|nr:hypothetical protein [Candidatus Moranbacteria bacterium]
MGDMIIETKIVVVAGRIAYGFIPANDIRNFVDGLFPYFAKYPGADFLSGRNHRWYGGHDLLLDVPNTFLEKGPSEAFRHFGHIVFTDFPTKDGIPIPGFSENGLGGFLAEHGIKNGSLHPHLFDTGIGFVCVAEGGGDLFNAISGNLEMSFGTFLDTFGEGAAEIAFGYSTQNPFLVASCVAGGIENIFAGVVSAWNTYTYYVDPIEFFGGAFGSAVIGASLTMLFSKEDLQERLILSAKNSGRSATIGALFTVNSFFGFGAIMGMMAFKLGQKSAEKDEENRRKYYKIDLDSCELFLKTLADGDPDFISFLRNSEPNMFDCILQPLDCSPEQFYNMLEPLDYIPNPLDDSLSSLDDSLNFLDDNNVMPKKKKI